MNKYYLNSLGINNAAGMSPRTVFDSIFIKSQVFEVERTLISGRKTRIKPVSGHLDPLPHHLSRFESRNNRLIKNSVDQIQNEVDFFLRKFKPSRIGIVLGTSTSGIQESENSFLSHPTGARPPHFKYQRQELSDGSEFLMEYLGAKGPHYTISTACTSSGKAFIEAKRLLQEDLCDAVLVGGVDTISHLTLDGFDSLESIAPFQTNPFSRNRRGINLGEGAAIFIVSKIEAEVLFTGFGESSDAYHISSPDPQGLGAELAIRGALQSAHLDASAIGYVNLHGTGTEKNDFMEGHTIHRIFGKGTPVSSTKPFIGHTLGAAAAQEAALCYLTLSTNFNPDRILPPHLWDQEKDPLIPELNFVTTQTKLNTPVIMSNSFAFGGNNVSLIFSRSFT